MNLIDEQVWYPPFFLFQEHKKILYYYPADVDIDSKIKNVGLVEATVKFSEWVYKDILRKKRYLSNLTGIDWK